MKSALRWLLWRTSRQYRGRVVMHRLGCDLPLKIAVPAAFAAGAVAGYLATLVRP